MHLRLPIHPVKGSRKALVGDRQKRAPVHSLLLAIAILLGCSAPVFALGISRLTLSKLETSAFPAISFYLELFDSQLNLVDDLTVAQVMLYEDQQPLQPKTLSLETRGVQFTIAINASPALGALVNNTEQLSAVRKNLMDWSGGQSAEFGDFSLAGNTGLQLIRSRDPKEWSPALDAFRPDLAQSKPGLFALTTAMDLADEQSAPELFKPAILFITAPLSQDETAGMGNLAARAGQTGVPVFVWLVVADPNAAQSTPIPGFAELQSLADTTGGKLALVSAANGFPPLNDWLVPLKKIYRVEYQSTLRANGEHSLSARVDRPGLSLTAARDLRFILDVLAPNPMFINPPARLERTWSEESSGQPAVLGPQSVDLQILVEFPDGHKRALHATRLFVNDTLVAENTAAPFERFTWDLSSLDAGAKVNLRVEAEDTLGMMGSSIESPVEVVVAAPPESGLLARITPQGLIAVGAVLLAGAVLAVVLIGENRQHARKAGKNGPRRKNDPVTQPVTILQEPAAVRRPRRAAAPSPSWPRGAGQMVAPARLIRLGENETPIQGSQLPVNRPELTFGSDPRKAVIALSDPSVCALHARILHTAEGEFFLADEGSVAGTWINYVPVNGQGVRLTHGDLIHFGRVTFRFELAEAPILPDPVIQLVDEGP
jgi:hypothetical protein